MTIIEVVILGFVLLETSNVLMLYFAPGSRNANAVGVFTRRVQKPHPRYFT